MSARPDVLTVGSVDDRTSTVVLVRSGESVVVVDPGMVASRRAILDPLRAFGIEPDEVTDVVFSHHHPDHTPNAALFARARYHHHPDPLADDQAQVVASRARLLALGPTRIVPGHGAPLEPA